MNFFRPLVVLLILLPSPSRSVELLLNQKEYIFASNFSRFINKAKPPNYPIEPLNPLIEKALDGKSHQLGQPEKTVFFNENRPRALPLPPADPTVPRIAILLPLSGQHAELGNAMLNAAKSNNLLPKN